MGIRDRHASAPVSTQRVLDPSGHVRISYLEPEELVRRLTTSDAYPLAVVSFGLPLPFSLPCPVVHLDLPILDRSRRCELWSCDQPVRTYKDQEVSIAISGSLLFGSITVAEDPDLGLDRATEIAYRHLLRQLLESGFPHLWRIWNYFPHINEDQHGLERYRLFCIGRHEALADNLPGFPASLPAGTAVGTQSGPLQIYFLAGAHPAQHLGNPRQVNAYDYPTIYGPRSPSFARASLYRSDSATQLFISGTASVVGHQSQHKGEADLQARETVMNLRALLDRVRCIPDSIEREARLQSVFKVYVRSRDHLDAVRTVLDDPLFFSSHLLYLQGDLCRKELVIEIEGLITAD